MANSKRNNIYELQLWLRRLSQLGYDIPPVVPDGIYGPETAKAVKAFQEQYGLPATGVADFKTWQAVKAAYAEAEAAASPGKPLCVFPSPYYVVSPKEQSDIVMCVQSILAALTVAYDEFENVEINGIYDEKTVDAVRLFQKINRIDETGVVDKKTWDRLVRSYNVYANHPGYTG